MNINKVIVAGRLGQDPEVRYTQSGDAVCNISLATSERWKDANGQQQERTEWHRITLFRKPAEICSEHMRKGDLAGFEGKLQTRKWQDQSGADRYTTEIIADRFYFGPKANQGGGSQSATGGTPGGQGQGQGQSQQSAPSAAPPASFEDFDDDIPF